jgi:hypothetical protein
MSPEPASMNKDYDNDANDNDNNNNNNNGSMWIQGHVQSVQITVLGK